jgi:hypothetical protein
LSTVTLAPEIGAPVAALVTLIVRMGVTATVTALLGTTLPLKSLPKA